MLMEVTLPETNRTSASENEGLEDEDVSFWLPGPFSGARLAVIVSGSVVHEIGAKLVEIFGTEISYRTKTPWSNPPWEFQVSVIH